MSCYGPLLQAVLCQLDGTLRVRLVGKINVGCLTRRTVVVNDDCTGAGSFICRDENVEVVPGYHTTGRGWAGAISGHTPEEKVCARGSYIFIEELRNG